MQKRILYTLSILTSLIFIFTSCNDDATKIVPDFNAHQYSSTNKEIAINFTDLSNIEAQEWIWTFEGGTPAVSYERDPVVSYSEAGTYNVTLTIRTTSGTKEITKFDYINIGDFYNSTWADIYITHNGQNKIAPVDETILLANIGAPKISYYAETSGLTSTRNQIGLLIYWNEDIILDDRSLFWDFTINDIFVFINFKNYGSDNFSSITVNLGDPEYKITDDITIPNDGEWKATGYYDAWDAMEIVANFENLDGFVSWTEGVHFDLLWEVNQGLDLLYDGSKNNKKSVAKSKKLRANGAKPIKQTGVKR